MSVWDMIPTCDDAMSVYTLVTFVLSGGVLFLIGKAGMRRLDDHDKDIKQTGKAINEMKTCIAVMTKSLENIETDGTETRTAIAEINRTLVDRLR